MIQKINKLLLICCLLHFHCAAYKKINTNDTTLAAVALHPYGRYIINSDSNLEMITTAMHFGFSFSGTQCYVYAAAADAQSHSYFQYELDGVYQKKIRINGNVFTPILLTASANGLHTIWIYKTTEATTGPLLIQKITGKKLQPLTVNNASLIEFIGNSITCGAAADASETPCGTGVYHDQHNAYYAYGPRVSRALHVNFIISSVSGIGIYRNWNSDGPTMPEVYENTSLNTDSSQKWNFSLYNPKIVSIALGTNDFSNGDGKKLRLLFDSAVFTEHYISFVKLVKSKYPKAKIALLSSPMVNGNNRMLLQNCLTAVKENIDKTYKKDIPVAVFFFAEMHAHGCSGHPDVQEHEVLAKELLPFFSKLLK